MNIDEAMARVINAGYGGIELWGSGGRFLARLRDGKTLDPIPSTVLWSWQGTAAAALTLIVEKAEDQAAVLQI